MSLCHRVRTQGLSGDVSYANDIVRASQDEKTISLRNLIVSRTQPLNPSAHMVGVMTELHALIWDQNFVSSEYLVLLGIDL